MTDNLAIFYARILTVYNCTYYKDKREGQRVCTEWIQEGVDKYKDEWTQTQLTIMLMGLMMCKQKDSKTTEMFDLILERVKIIPLVLIKICLMFLREDETGYLEDLVSKEIDPNVDIDLTYIFRPASYPNKEKPFRLR